MKYDYTEGGINMSRMKKQITLEEQLEKVVTDIETTKTILKNLRKTKKELEEKNIINQLKKLYDKIISKGMSIEEVMELLDKIES